MLKENPKTRLKNYWFDIVLTTVSIVQGFVFNDLANRLPSIYVYTRMNNDWLIIFHFALSFIILLRIYQTYIVGALGFYFIPTIFDLFLVFFTGLFQYFIFSTLPNANSSTSTISMDVVSYHKRFILLALIGLGGYIQPILRKTNMFTQKDNHLDVVKDQVINLVFLLIVSFISGILIISNGAWHLSIYLLLVFIQIVLFSLNNLVVNFHHF